MLATRPNPRYTEVCAPIVTELREKMKSENKLSNSKLVEKTIEVLDSFHDDIDTEDFIRSQLSLLGNEASSEQQLFILQVFSGISQFSSVLELTVDALYQRYDILNSKRSRLLFIVYLIIIEFEKLDILELLHAASSRLSKLGFIS